MTKLSLTILVAALLVSAPVLGAKEIFERTKPHVNVGAQSGYLSPEYQSPLAQDAYFKSASAQQNAVPKFTPIRKVFVTFDSAHVRSTRPQAIDTKGPSENSFKQQIDRAQNAGGGYMHHLRVKRDAEGSGIGELFDGQYFINKSMHSTGQSNEPVNGLYVDSDSDGYGNSMGNTGRTVTPAYRETTDMHSLGTRAVCDWPFSTGWPCNSETTGVRRIVGRMPNPSSSPGSTGLEMQSQPSEPTGTNTRVLAEPLKVYPAPAVVGPGRDSLYQGPVDRGGAAPYSSPRTVSLLLLPFGGVSESGDDGWANTLQISCALDDSMCD